MYIFAFYRRGDRHRCDRPYLATLPAYINLNCNHKKNADSTAFLAKRYIEFRSQIAAVLIYRTQAQPGYEIAAGSTSQLISA